MLSSGTVRLDCDFLKGVPHSRLHSQFTGHTRQWLARAKSGSKQQLFCLFPLPLCGSTGIWNSRALYKSFTTSQTRTHSECWHRLHSAAQQLTHTLLTHLPICIKTQAQNDPINGTFHLIHKSMLVFNHYINANLQIWIMRKQLQINCSLASPI